MSETRRSDYVTMDRRSAYVALEAAFWMLAERWQSHLFYRPRCSFDFAAFAPEARRMMKWREATLFDALKVATNGVVLRDSRAEKDRINEDHDLRGQSG